MKKLFNFNDYLFNKLTEEVNVKVNELELILSPMFRKVLKEINHKISDDLLELHKDSKPEFKKTFIDVGSDSDKVSFIQSNKVPELIEPDIVHGYYSRNKDAKKPDDDWRGEYEFTEEDKWKNPWIKDIDHVIDLHDIQFTDKKHPVWNKYRSEVKIGRFINQMFPGKYPANVRRDDQKAKPEDIESFVNMYIASVESNSKKIEKVSGEDIRYYYNCENYYKDSGTLGGSCMKDTDKGHQLDIYVDNPEKISMLVLYPEGVRDKIIGRAILWKLDRINGTKVENQYFMDRIYVANDSDEYMYIEYAKRNGYHYKSSQSYGTEHKIVKPNGEKEFITMEVDLKPVDYDPNYPYMDTMQYYNPVTGTITNNEDGYRTGEYGILTNYEGPISYY